MVMGKLTWCKATITVSVFPGNNLIQDAVTFILKKSEIIFELKKEFSIVMIRVDFQQSMESVS